MRVHSSFCVLFSVVLLCVSFCDCALVSLSEYLNKLTVSVPSISFQAYGISVNASQISAGNISVKNILAGLVNRSPNSSSSFSSSSASSASSSSLLPMINVTIDGISITASATWSVDFNNSDYNAFDLHHNGNFTAVIANTSATLLVMLEPSKFEKKPEGNENGCNVTVPSVITVDDCSSYVNIDSILFTAEDPDFQDFLVQSTPKLINFVEKALNTFALCEIAAEVLEGSVSNIIKEQVIEKYIIPYSSCNNEKTASSSSSSSGYSSLQQPSLEKVNSVLSSDDSLAMGSNEFPNEITQDYSDILNLQTSPLIDALAVFADFLKIDGKMPINHIANLLTSYSGNYSLNIPFEEQLNSYLNLKLDSIFIGGINTFKIFNVLKAISEYDLFNRIALKRLFFTANTAIGITLPSIISFPLDQSSDYSNTIEEKIAISADVSDIDITADIRLMLKKQFVDSLTIDQIIDMDCIKTIFANGTAISSLFGTATINSASLAFIEPSISEDGSEPRDYTLERELFSAASVAVQFAINSLHDNLPAVLLGAMELARTFVNDVEINQNLLSNQTCAPKLLEGNSPNDLFQTQLVIVIAITLFASAAILIRTYMRLVLKKGNLKEFKDSFYQNGSFSAEGLFLDLTGSESINRPSNRSSDNIVGEAEMQDLSNHNTGSALHIPFSVLISSSESVSLFAHPKVSNWLRLFVPLAIVVDLSLLLVANFSKDASVFARVQLQGEESSEIMYYAYNFQMLKAASDLWKSGALFLAFLIVILSFAFSYIKLIVMLFVWFVPSTLIGKTKRRNILLIIGLFILFHKTISFLTYCYYFYYRIFWETYITLCFIGYNDGNWLENCSSLPKLFCFCF
eukprot:TRINITY_DN3306_c0_g1_i1.p1 TRINITY_DN3306_c0_g1~~TRINITY_DN3306_c0_g1_i1.p1  ORF type:complete len:858 (+),score=264.66 TRINITY_DN3306_c0_g1_i1:73-2646(+)